MGSEENRWSMNPLISNDIYLDLDDDSYDCDGDGEIAVYEVYSNLREWQARTYGKEAERYNVPLELGFYDYATDAINALSEEEGLDNEQANNRLYDLFSEKLHDGFPVTQNRLDKINELNEDNFNNSLIGISDPTILIQTVMECLMVGNIAIQHLFQSQFQFHVMIIFSQYKVDGD